MAAGIILILLACILILIGVLLAFRVVPGVSGSGAGFEGEVSGAGSAHVPRTAANVRNAILGFIGLVSLLLIASGIFLIIDDASIDREERLARIRNSAQSIVEDEINRSNAAPTPGRPTATPGPRTPTAVPRTPTPSSGGSSERGNQLLQQALEADKAGDTDRAIQLYSQAINAGLDPASTRAAQLSMALMDLDAIGATPNRGDLAARCARASQNLRSAASGEGRTSQLAADASRELAGVCP